VEEQGRYDRLVTQLTGASILVTPMGILTVLVALVQPIWALYAWCFIIGCYVLWRVGGAIMYRAALWIERKGIARQLKQLLKRKGLSDLPEEDPQVIAEREAFLRDEQLNALVKLRQRFAEPPQALDLLGAFVQTCERSASTIKMTPLIAAAFGLVAYLFGSSPLMAALVSTLCICSAIGALLWWDALTTHHEQSVRYEEYLVESRRIVTLSELAGGLSVPEVEVEFALAGTLSIDDHEATRGAVEVVNR
jgi:hypothetical protein